MSKFDEFNARVERAKAEADQGATTGGKYRPHTDPHGSGLGKTFLSVIGDFLVEFFGTMFFWLLFGAIVVGAVAITLGVSFWVALGILGLVFVLGAGFAAGGWN